MTTWPSVVKVRGPAIALVLAVLAAPAIGRGEPGTPGPAHQAALEGTIERVDGDMAVVDLGSVDGIERGDRVTVWQVVKGRRVEIGPARVVRVAEEECRIGLRKLPKGAVRPGDVVVAEPTGWAEPAEPPAQAVPDVPKAPPAPPVPPPAPVVKAPPPRTPALPRVAHDPVSRIPEGMPLQVSVVAIADPPLAGATLSYRTGKSREWVDVAMERTGDAGWTATIPATAVADRSLSYYVRGIDPEGRKVPVFAGPHTPWKVAVEPPTRGGGGPRAGMIGSFEWQEFYLAQPNRDTFWRAELGFEYRPNRGVVKAIRAGFGAVEGIGGYTEDVEAGVLLSHRAVGYAWIEPVFRFGRYVRWIPRVMLGAVGDYSNPSFRTDMPHFDRGEVIGGAGSLLEFGPEDLFSIGLKGSFLVPVGTELAIVTTVQAGHGFQAGLSLGATSFPVHEEWSGQVMLMGGWHGVEWMSIDAKIGVNVRSTEHAGVGGGLGLSFWW